MDSSGMSMMSTDPVDISGLLVGSWFAAITWGIESFQLAVYLTRYRKDSIVLKCAVVFLFCADTTWNVMFLVGTYFHVIVVQPFTMASYIPTLSLASASTMSVTEIFGVNLFLIHRYWKLTRRVWLSAVLLMIALSSYACHLWATIVAVQYQSMDVAELVKWAASKGYDQATQGGKVGLALEVTMVCSIWLLLLAHLLTLLRKDMQNARKIVLRLIIVTLESGTCASAVAIAALVYYLGHPKSTNSIVVGFFVARVYYMNMLFNLNMRGSGGILMREVWTQSNAHRITGHLPDSNGVQLSHLPSSSNGGDRSRIQHSVVHVSQSVATHVDKEKEFIKDRDLEDQL